MLLGATAAESKTKFMDWMDNLVSSVVGEEAKLYTLSGERQQGTFINLSNSEFAKVIAKLTKLRIWSSAIVARGYTCGAFFMIIGGCQPSRNIYWTIPNMNIFLFINIDFVRLSVG